MLLHGIKNRDIMPSIWLLSLLNTVAVPSRQNVTAIYSARNHSLGHIKIIPDFC